MTIKSFRSKEAARVFWREHSHRLPQQIQQRARERLVAIDAAQDLRDLSVPPGNRFERLEGDRAGQWSLRINSQWRVCFRWDGTDAWDVEITDYHD